MVNQFNFFRGIVGPRVVATGGEFYAPYIPLQITHAPPFGISRRHWNMMPQDLRGGPTENMVVYIQGWEAARDANYNNPYTNLIPGELWNRGWHAWWERRNRTGQNFRNVNPNPPIDERYPEFYNTDELIFFDVTEVIPDPNSNRPYKFMLFRHIEEGNTVQGQRIYSDHPMYNFPNII
jgi:muramidase (phage lysozyme)